VRTDLHVIYRQQGIQLRMHLIYKRSTDPVISNRRLVQHRNYKISRIF